VDASTQPSERKLLYRRGPCKSSSKSALKSSLKSGDLSLLAVARQTVDPAIEYPRSLNVAGSPTNVDPQITAVAPPQFPKPLHEPLGREPVGGLVVMSDTNRGEGDW
jgi:hypothetical protein